MKQNICPSLDELGRLFGADLSDGEVAHLEEHLASCSDCLERLKKSLPPADTIHELLTQATITETRWHPAVETLINRLENLRPSQGDKATVNVGLATQGFEEDAAEGETSTGALWNFLAPPENPGELGRLGSYRVLKVLGHGGMGVVFQAEDVELQRLIALKAMLPKLAANPSAKKRFLREARAAAAIKHDNIVTIHHVGEDRGAPYLAMEYLQGEPLDVRLQREPVLPLADLLAIGREVAEGLAAAHEHGLIHRDIKPGNIWLEAKKGGGARVKILDFGLARSSAEATNLTQAGMIIGTPAFMAPEQAAGRPIDHRCDLFSLGAMLYRMATGGLPFQGNDTLAILSALANHQPPAPSEINKKIPAEVSRLILGLLSKKPEARPASAQEVAESLRRLERNLAISTSPAPPKRRRGVLVALGFGLFALVAAAIVLFLPAGDGTIRVEINDDKIEVLVTSKGIKILGTEKQKEIHVAPGPHTLTVQRDGFTFETEKIVLKNGDKITLKVEWLPGSLTVVRADTGAVLGKAAGAPKKLEVLGSGRWPFDPADGKDYVWSKPESVNVNSTEGEHLWGISGDERTLYFYREGGLHVARRKRASEPFGPPSPIPGMTSLQWMGAVSSNGLSVALVRTAKKKQETIWMASRSSIDEAFSAPEALGTPVHTPRASMYPVLSADGLTLLICSIRAGSRSGDIWMFTRPSLGQPFDKTEQLPEPINTPDWDMPFYVSNDRCFIIASRQYTTPQNTVEREVQTFTRAAPNDLFGPGRSLELPLGDAEKSDANGGFLLSGDGRSIYFHTSKLAGGPGAEDIWVCRRVPKVAPPQVDPMRKTNLP